MDYPIIYDKFETNFFTYGLAILEKVSGLRVFQRLNGEYVCSFSYPRDDEKAQYLIAENYVKVNGQLFIIKTPTDSHVDVMVTDVECEHVFFELMDKFIPLLTVTNQGAQVTLEQLLADTRFTAHAITVPGQSGVELERETPIAGINQMCMNWDCELARNNFDVTLVPQIGNDNGVQFRYSKNIRSIRRRVDTKGVITRLHVFGKDGLTIPPIDSPNLNNYPSIKEGKAEFNEIDNPADLQAAGEEYLATVDTPAVAYEIEVVELKKAVGYDDSESFGLGDTVRVTDQELGVDILARIIEYEEYPLEPENSKVTIANFIPLITDTLASLQESRNIVRRVTFKGKINTFWLNGVIDTLKNQLKASGSYANAEVIPDAGYLLENNNPSSPDYGALYIGPGIFAVANSKTNGEWNWRTFGTGKGFTADEINAGILRTAFIKIEGDDNFYWDQENLYVIDPVDPNKQIRIGKYDGTNYGIGFTSDGGDTFGMVFTHDERIRVFDADGNERVSIADLGGGRFGIELKKPDGTVTVTTDTDGIMKILHGEIAVEHTNGSKTLIDGESFKVLPDKDDADDYIGVDSEGLHRSIDGTKSYFVQGVQVGSGTISSSVSGAAASIADPNRTTTFALTGNQWVGKAGKVKIQVSVESYDSPPDATWNILKTRAAVDSIVENGTGLTVTIRGGATYYKSNGNPSTPYDFQDKNLKFSYIAITS